MKEEVKEFIEDFCFNGNCNMYFEKDEFFLTLKAAKIGDKMGQDFHIEDVIKFIRKHINETNPIKLTITEDIIEDWLNIILRVKYKTPEYPKIK